MAACRYHRYKLAKCTNCPMVGVFPLVDEGDGFSFLETVFGFGEDDVLLRFFKRADIKVLPVPTLETRTNIANGLYMECKLWDWDPLGGPLKKYNQLDREIQDLLDSGVSDIEPDNFEFSSEWESVPFAESGRPKDSKPIVCGLFSCLGVTRPCLYHQALREDCDPGFCLVRPIFPPSSSHSDFEKIFARFSGDEVVERFFLGAAANPMTLSLLARQTIADSLSWESQEWIGKTENGGPLLAISKKERKLAVLQHNKNAGSEAGSRSNAYSNTMDMFVAGVKRVCEKGGSVEVVFPPYAGKAGQGCREEGGVHCRKPSGRPLSEAYTSSQPRVEHAHWNPTFIISGHTGWVRCIAVHPNNTWFCTGSADNTIKMWDLANRHHKQTLTGHVDQVRGVTISSKHSHIFSAGDDGLVMCWDVEKNKVIHSYQGHVSGVFSLALHPTDDVLLSGGQDSVCRVWDIRSKMQIHALSGHEGAVYSVFTRPTYPQVITASNDSTIKLWDLRYGGAMETLKQNTNSSSVRAMAPHPTEDCFVAASRGGIKKYNLPHGQFMFTLLPRTETRINSAAVNEEGVLATADENGSLWFWDWGSGHNFQQTKTFVRRESLPCEARIYSITYDKTGSKLITCEADKTIKMWEEADWYL